MWMIQPELDPLSSSLCMQQCAYYKTKINRQIIICIIQPFINQLGKEISARGTFDLRSEWRASHFIAKTVPCNPPPTSLNSNSCCNSSPTRCAATGSSRSIAAALHKNLKVINVIYSFCFNTHSRSCICRYYLWSIPSTSLKGTLPPAWLTVYGQSMPWTKFWKDFSTLSILHLSAVHIHCPYGRVGRVWWGHGESQWVLHWPQTKLC